MVPLWLRACLLLISTTSNVNVESSFDILNAPAPLFRDPLYDGAADPSIIFSKETNEWFLYYTQRRANIRALRNRSWCFGTDIAVAISNDMGRTWRYSGPAQGLKFEGGRNTYWAPDVVRAPTGEYHLFVTYIKGAATTRSSWGGKQPQRIAHFMTVSLRAPWRFRGLVEGLLHVLDPDVRQLPGGEWKMWFKDIRRRGQTGAAVSSDGGLNTWKRLAQLETDGVHLVSEGGREGTIPASGLVPPHEAPNVFSWKGFYWLLVDPMHSPGIIVLRSTDASNWVRQKEPILHFGGVRPMDSTDGNHVDVITVEDKAFVFYFVHPGRPCCEHDRSSLQFRQSAIQVAELEFVKDPGGSGGRLKCRRDRYVQWAREKRKRSSSKKRIRR